MDNFNYAEWVPAGRLVKGLVAMVFAIILFVTLALFTFIGVSVESIASAAISWILFTFILLIYWNLRGLQIQISKDRLIVVYGHFNRKTYLHTDIVSCKRTKASFGRYWGVGIRYGFDGSLAYTTSLGDAVEVTPKIGRKFVFSSNKPDQVCKAIKNMLQNQPATLST